MQSALAPHGVPLSHSFTFSHVFVAVSTTKPSSQVTAEIELGNEIHISGAFYEFIYSSITYIIQVIYLFIFKDYLLFTKDFYMILFHIRY